MIFFLILMQIWLIFTTKVLHLILACVASVSLRFRSKEREMRVKDRMKNGASKRAGKGWERKVRFPSFPFPSPLFHCLALGPFLARPKPKISFNFVLKVRARNSEMAYSLDRINYWDVFIDQQDQNNRNLIGSLNEFETGLLCYLKPGTFSSFKHYCASVLCHLYDPIIVGC